MKNITVGYGQCGNLVQDVAAIRTLQTLTDEYLHKYGYDDVAVTTVLHQWMGGFPADEAKAFGVIATGSLIAAFSKATKVIVKSPHEAVGIQMCIRDRRGERQCIGTGPGGPGLCDPGQSRDGGPAGKGE